LKVYEVKISPLADGDLLSIWDFISQENPLAAERLLERIGDRIDSLSRFPERGKPMTHIVSGARCLIESRYLIFYRILDDEVEVVRVVHGSMDLPKVFS
jgi:toxin ParE1/3/4